MITFATMLKSFDPPKSESRTRFKLGYELDIKSSIIELQKK